MTDKIISQNKLKTQIDNKSDQDTIASRVRYKRKKLGLMSKQLAEMCNVPPSSINMLEMGRVKHPKYIIVLAEKLQETTDFLLNGTTSLHSKMNTNSNLLSVSDPIQPDFESSDYYVVKMTKGSKPFYMEGMVQVGTVNGVFIEHKK